MEKERLAAFSDGVIAIIITIMVLELKAPHGGSPGDLLKLVPAFLSYVLSFVYVAIYWNNHHHMLATVTRVNGAILWANMHLLFWLSLIPFATGWMGENHFAALPTAFYGMVLLMAGVAYLILQYSIVRVDGPESPLGKALGVDWKGKVSLISYVPAILVSFWLTPAAHAIYVAVALLWLVPDTRIERALEVAD